MGGIGKTLRLRRRPDFLGVGFPPRPLSLCGGESTAVVFTAFFVCSALIFRIQHKFLLIAKRDGKNQCGNRVCENVKNMDLFKGGALSPGLEKSQREGTVCRVVPFCVAYRCFIATRKFAVHGLLSVIVSIFSILSLYLFLLFVQHKNKRI
jgi:hypothetical protein